ncbi:helix-turn-helix transcriptional regulator [Nocardia crassostreae]|uniref:helix-turn-helix transcriptional regulator n=1 Tax=Nocardia crassostreae TaxID=53428 RepID=UPI000B045297|nr:helix-turn-helix transcriptional regulator [Nocardia crassostreae]
MDDVLRRLSAEVDRACRGGVGTIGTPREPAAPASNAAGTRSNPAGGASNGVGGGPNAARAGSNATAAGANAAAGSHNAGSRTNAGGPGTNAGAAGPNAGGAGTNAAEPGAVGLGRAVAAAVRAAVPFDSWCVITLDPATLLPTGGFHREGIPEAFAPRLVEIEARGDDLCAVPAMAHAAIRTAALGLVTEGRFERSQRYNEVFVPVGLRDEMRVLFTSKADVWGALIMLRTSDSPDFTPADAELVGRATADVGAALRHQLVLAEIDADQHADGPGLVLLDDRYREISTTLAARRWLSEMDDDTAAFSGVPYCVLHLARQVGGGPRRTRIRTRTGRWLTLHAEALDGGRVSVIVEPTRPQDIAQLIADAYQLTARERHIVRLLSSGHSRAEIAKQLRLSAHTVNDHVKNVFGKVGVRSRAELTAKLFFDQYIPRMESGTPVGASGWFLG